jgi:23S rRNA-/tRNA-specific pseudouridylate synthase
VDETAVRQLVAIGAVYYAEKPPPRNLTGIARALRPKRVRDPDLCLPSGSYCRVHVHPKRFPGIDAVDWRARVVASGEDWVVVDKPPGFSVNPTVDNAVECAAAFVARALRGDETARKNVPGFAFPRWSDSEPLKVLHRLDVATSGVLMFARGEGAFAGHFHEALRGRRVRKRYTCVTVTRPPMGVLEHWTTLEPKNGETTPRRHLMFSLRDGDTPWSGAMNDLEGVDGDGRKRCVLRVTRVVPLLRDETSELFSERSTESETKTDPLFFECEVELVTGRTHQIRAQFAAVGAPLVGDVLYGGMSLSAVGMRDSVRLETSKPRVLDENDLLCLQSSAMTIEPDPDPNAELHETDGKTFCAGRPWWRRS